MDNEDKKNLNKEKKVKYNQDKALAEETQIKEEIKKEITNIVDLIKRAGSIVVEGDTAEIINQLAKSEIDAEDIEILVNMTDKIIVLPDAAGYSLQPRAILSLSSLPDEIKKSLLGSRGLRSLLVSGSIKAFSGDVTDEELEKVMSIIKKNKTIYERMLDLGNSMPAQTTIEAIRGKTPEEEKILKDLKKIHDETAPSADFKGVSRGGEVI